MAPLPPEPEPLAPSVAWRAAAPAIVIAAACIVAFVIVFGRYGDWATAGMVEALAEAQYRSGKDFEAEGNYPQAIYYYRQALGSTFRSEEKRLLCLLSLGDLLFREARYEEAVKTYEQLPAEGFAKSGAYAGYVGALLASGRREEGVEAARRWLSLAQEEGNAQQIEWAAVTLGREFEAVGDYAGAQRAYGLAAEANPVSEARIYEAAALFKQGAREAAETTFESIFADASLAAIHIKARNTLAALRASPGDRP